MQGWIVFCFPSCNAEAHKTMNRLRTTKKKVKLLFWHNKKWQSESIEILQTDHETEIIQQLINNWLNLLDDEGIMQKKVTIQSVLLSPKKQLYVSFDRNPFDAKQSAQEKLIWIEGLLKTIRENGVSFQNIHFLVHHQTLQDYHLDFSNSWPMSGFLKL